MPVIASPRLTCAWPARLAASRSMRFSPAELGEQGSVQGRAGAFPADRRRVGAAVDGAGESITFEPGAVSVEGPSLPWRVLFGEACMHWPCPG